jgi:hypothetical protein
LKLPGALIAELEAEAKRRGTSKSEVMRDALGQVLGASRRRKAHTCLDRMGDLLGSQPGPRDASTNPRYLEGFGRGRKGPR